MSELTTNPLLVRLERWPRVGRIVLSMVITTLIVAMLWILFTLIFGVDAGSNAVVRFLLIFGGGMTVYVYGWWALVGFNDSDHPWHPTPHSMYYLLAGVLAFVLDIVLLIIGLASADIL